MSNPEDWVYVDPRVDPDECPHNANVDYQFDQEGNVVGFTCNDCGFTTDW